VATNNQTDEENAKIRRKIAL